MSDVLDFSAYVRRICWKGKILDTDISLHVNHNKIVTHASFG